MRKYAWIYILITALVFIWGLRYFMNRPLPTEVARIMEFEDTISVSGVLVRDEIIYKTQTGGGLQPQVFDETRVAKGKKIATIYTDGIDPSLKAEFNNIDEKIAKLEASTAQSQVFGNDISTIETRVKASVDEVVSASISSDLSNIDVVSKELSSLFGTHQKVSGQKNPRQTALNELYAKRREIESRINSAKKDIYSLAGGVYISGVDGCEQILTPEVIMNMGVEEFNALSLPKRTEPKDVYGAGEYVCKTVDNGIWYVAAALKTEEVGELEAGDWVRVRMPEHSATSVKACVESISEESGGQKLVVLSSREYIKNVYSERCVKLDIIKNNYYGLKIPISAVRVGEEATGVFVNSDGVAKFRKINILYKNEEYAIVEKSDKSGFLKLYDPVIIDGSSVEEDAIIN